MFDFNDLKKVELSSPLSKGGKIDGPTEVIVKTVELDYAPKGVDVRARISPRIFTTEILPSQMLVLEKDPGIQSVSISKPYKSSKDI